MAPSNLCAVLIPELLVNGSLRLAIYYVCLERAWAYCDHGYLPPSATYKIDFEKWTERFTLALVPPFFLALSQLLINILLHVLHTILSITSLIFNFPFKLDLR